MDDYTALEEDIEALELENAILKEILIQLEEDWFNPKFDHIWKEQTEIYREKE